MNQICGQEILNTDFTLGDCLFGAVKLPLWILINMNVKAVVLDLMYTPFFVYQSILIIKKYVLVLSEGPTYGLDDPTITAEAGYSVDITISRNKTCLSLHHNARSSFLYAKSVEIQSKRFYS